MSKIIASRRLGAFTALAVTLALGACTDFRKAAGWDKAPPDEFRVISRAPLSVPPDFGLRPPAPGTPRPQEGTPTDQARSAVTGTRTPARNTSPNAVSRTSPAEQALLTRVGADRITPSIRETVNREASQLADADRSFTDRLIFWRAPSPSGTVVDAEREQQRIRENQALGRTTTDGDTPIIRKRQRGILEGLF